MSLLLSLYLGDLLAASPCTEIILKQDNCPSYKDYHCNHVVVPFASEPDEDLPSVTSSLPELSRWDSSSSSSTSCKAINCTSTKHETVSGEIMRRGQDKVQKCLRPPRRQLSWEERGFCSDDGRSSCGDDEVSSCDMPSHESMAFPAVAAMWDVHVLQQCEAQPTSNPPPRPPPRRMRSLLKSFPQAELGPASTLWRPGAASRNTSVSVPDAHQLFHKIPMLSSGRQQSLRDLSDGLQTVNDRKESDAAAPHDVLPPRQPRRQGTPEIINKKAVNSPSRSDEFILPKSKESGDSLYNLLKLKRVSQV